MIGPLQGYRTLTENRNATAAVIGAGVLSALRLPRNLRPKGLPFCRATAWRQADAAGCGDRGGRRTGLRAFTGCAQGGRDGVPPRRRCDCTARICIFNVGANVNFPLLETTERVFRKVWEWLATRLAGHEAAGLTLPRGRGNIFFIGPPPGARRGRLCRLRQPVHLRAVAVVPRASSVQGHPRRPSGH